MNMRDEWTIGDSETFSDVFYNREETIQSVKENFDIRRFYTPEGYDIEINGITERCLVQMPSNPLRELNDYRKIHCPIDSDVKRGYYVKYEGTVWIIDTNVANVDGAYLSTRMSRCQYLLRWQDRNGNIIEKWGYSTDQTKYSGGESGNSVVTVGDNQYALLLPIDDDTKKLKREMRFAVDFEDSEEPDVYRLSNRKVNLNNELYFNRGGTMSITLSYDVLNRDKDKQITLDDGRKVWICDYKESLTPNLPPADEMTDLCAIISGNKDLKVGFPRTYTVSFTTEEGNAVDLSNIDFSWNIVSDFDIGLIEQTINDNAIRLSINDEELIGSSFLLQIIANDLVIGEIEINVTAII